MELINDDSLRLIVMKNCSEIGNKVDEYIKTTRGIKDTNFTYQVPIKEVRFNNGEGKVVIDASIRGRDIYIITDVCNHSLTYDMYGYTNHMSPDDHLQDLKRVIAALRHHGDRIHVAMTQLYSSRQHKRKGRESLDCAVALQELRNMDVHGIITFDAHDPGVEGTIPLYPFENFYPTYEILCDIIEKEKLYRDPTLKNIKTMVVSPDDGALQRAKYFAHPISVKVATFTKGRDPETIDGMNNITEHQYLGDDVNGKIILIPDDMISSGESILDTAITLKEKGAAKIFFITTFSLFTKGISKFNDAYKNGIFNKLYTTNLSYVSQEAKEQPWLKQTDCTPFLGEIIHRINKDESISSLKNGREKVLEKIKKEKQWTLE